MIGSTVLILYIYILNQASIQVSGDPLTLAYTSKKLSVASAAAFMLYRYAAGSSHSCPWQSSSDSRCAFLPQHFSTAFTASSVAARDTNMGLH